MVATDNGSPCTSKALTTALRALGAVHLRNVPRTPQHNARAERVFRDWKHDADLGCGVVLASVEALPSASCGPARRRNASPKSGRAPCP